MILGNKCDMEDKRQVSKDRGEAVSIQGEGVGWVCLGYSREQCDMEDKRQVSKDREEAVRIRGEGVGRVCLGYSREQM